MYDYQGYADGSVASTEVRANTAFIESYFDVLHGHFHACKYLDVFPDAAFIATLRHPVDRIISQFMHELNEDSADAKYHADLVSGKMDIVDFACEDGIGNAMTQHLEGRALRDYAALIISERLLLSCQVFSLTVRRLDLEAQFGRPIQLPVLNQGAARPNGLEISHSVKQAIFSRVQPDVELYRSAFELLEERIRRVL